MLDGIGEYFCLALAVLLGVLLGANDDGLGAIASVNPVKHFVQTLHLLYLFGVDVEEVLL